MTTPSFNPLSEYFRQPSIYINLPSKGKFWPDGSLEQTATGELAVYPMTTKDEITLRTPDALLNGIGVVSVIQSCIPSIKNAWDMPSIDADTALIAIRIASYGNLMDIQAKCPHCGEEHDYEVNLHGILEGIKTPNYDDPIEVGDLLIKLRPQSYQAVNKTNQIEYEEERLIEALRNVDDADDFRQVKFDEHLNRMITLSLEAIASATEFIQLPNGIKVTDHSHLLEYYSNIGGTVVGTVRKWLEGATELAKLPTPTVTCQNCEKEMSITLTFDHARFFV